MNSTSKRRSPARIDIVLRAVMLACDQRDVTGFMQFDFYIAD